MMWRDAKGRRYESHWGFRDEQITSYTVQAKLVAEALRHSTLREISDRRMTLTGMENADGFGGVTVFSERYVQGLAKLAGEKLPKGMWRNHVRHLCEAVLRARIYGEEIYRAIGFAEGVLMTLGGVEKTVLQDLERSSSPRKGGKQV